MDVSSAGGISLIGGLVALDFANTAGGRDLPEPIEHLRALTDLAEWTAHARAVDPDTARQAVAALTEGNGEGEKLLRHAVSLREAIYRAGAAIARGEAAREADLDAIRDVARKAIGAATLVAVAGAGYAFDFSRAPAEMALLGPIAWSAVDFLQHGRLDRLKQCPGYDCGWLFIDTSKNGSRRWCDMATCGNRTKVNRHRHRH